MAKWQKVIVSGSNAILSQVTASGGFKGDGSGLTGISADSLGNSLVDGNGIADFTFDGGSSGVVVALDLNGSTLNLGSSGVKVADAGITETQLHTSVAGAGLAGGGGTVLSVGVDGSTVEISSDAVRVKDAGITMAKLANVATDTFIGRTASGNGVPKALSKAEALAILNVADGANANVSGNSGNAAIYDNGGTPAFKSGITKAEVLTLINVADGATADQSDAEILTAIEDGVDSVHYVDLSIDTAHIADAQITMAKLANIATDTFIGRTAASNGVPKALSKAEALAILNVADGATADQSDAEILTAIENGVDSVHYVNASIDAEHLASNSVTNAKLADNAVDTAEIAASAVETAKINNLAVTAGKIAASAVETAKINNLAVTTAKIADNAVTGDKLADNIVIAGTLTVNGGTTTLNTTNLSIEDQFITIASGSQSATDGGIVVSKQANGAGFGFGYDTATTRWVFDNDLAVAATGIVADAFVGTVQLHASAAPSANPVYGADSYGHGTIYIKKDTADIYIYA